LAVSGSIARSCEGGGIVVDGADAALDKNRVAGTNGAALRVRGPGALITRNTVAGVGGACARVDGDGATVDRNRLSACGGVGIDVRGSGLRLSKNQVRSADTGLDVSCRAIPTVCADAARTTIAACSDQATEPACAATAQQSANNGLISCFWDGTCNACNLNQEEGGSCTDTCLATPGDRCADALADGNKIAETFEDECIRAQSFDTGLRLERNQLSLCSQGGVSIEGTAVHAERNTVTDCGAFANAAGFQLEGSGHTLVSNVARGCSGDGFRIETGENVSLTGNEAIENYDDGFDVQGGLTIVIEDAVAKNNVAGGIEIGEFATTTTVSGSRASGNLLDFCDEGSGTTSAGNQFGTSGAPCTPD
ncbi:MAG TPA: right-handed parallel beta-helix repeat-containing protein, partial [Myxococcota bacterium]|nr:right-handed parallel beta-helix repeat-containing protein [Myxococcota bacterium]